MRLSKLDWEYIQERAADFTGRRWLFSRLDKFLRGRPGVFLLHGGPGTGKTAVAARLAMASAGRLAHGDSPALSTLRVHAAYFCRAGQTDLLDVAQRLSEQPVEAVPSFRQALLASLSSAHSVPQVSRSARASAECELVWLVMVG